MQEFLAFGNNKNCSKFYVQNGDVCTLHASNYHKSFISIV